MDLTLKNPSVFKEINRTFVDFFDFPIQNQLFPLRCRLGSPWAPCIYPDFERYPPKWFSAINCAIWLRLIFRGRGSAWFFGTHLLFFHARGQILEAWVGFWIPEVDILARGRFWSDFGVLKKTVLQRNGFVVRIQGNLSCPNESMVPRSHMDRLLCPQTPLKNRF